VAFVFTVLESELFAPNWFGRLFVAQRRHDAAAEDAGKTAAREPESVQTSEGEALVAY
jgi:hypothetical protein